MLDQPDHPILKHWLGGTTCSNWVVRRSVLFESRTHIVLRHYAHASYCDRVVGVLNCEAYASLYRKSQFDEAVRHDRIWTQGSGELKQWSGRINKSRILDDCKQMGIEFEIKQPAAIAV